MRYRILIVEDEPISLEMLSKTLKEDYDVLTADNGEKGFELYKKFNPHIIISDLNMPIMNGIELIQKIRELDQNSKIIITTFKDDVQTLLQATELKLFKYLIKPIDFTTLKNIIEESIEELNRFAADTVVTPELLFSEGIVKKGKAIDGIKILGDGEVSIKLTVQAQKFSKTAAEKIEAAGGKAEVI